MVAAIPRPRLNARPLAESWQASVDRLSALSDEAPPYPITWINLDKMDDRIAELTRAKAPPPPSPELVQAMMELGDMTRAYNSLAAELRDGQRWLDRARSDWKHQLLKDISADCYQTLPPLPTGDHAPDFTSVPAARQAARDLLPRMQWLRGILAKISEAGAFDAMPPEHQAIQLAKALHRQTNALTDRLEAVEAFCMALQAQSGKRPNKSKRSTTKRKAA